MKKNWRTENHNNRVFWTAAFLILVFGVYFAWACTQRQNFSADENMRYDIVQYIYNHGSLPHGGDPEIRNEDWGISYAFNPILSYMGSALLMKIASFFTDNGQILLIAARMMNVILGVGTAWFILLIARKVFGRLEGIMFLFLCTFLPGAAVLFTYINCDALALFSSAVIIYVWLLSMEQGWTYKNCIFLGTGIAFNALSYYNAYGYALCSILFFSISILLFGDKKWDFKELIKKGLVVTLVVALLAGWWFVRNYLIYDGDFLGRTTAHAYAVKYARPDFNPETALTFQENPQTSVLSMMFFKASWMKDNWLMTVVYSFIGTFGYNKIYLSQMIYTPYILFLLLGMGAVLLWGRDFFYLRRKKISVSKEIVPGEEITDIVVRTKGWSQKAVFHLSMLLALIIPNALNVYYSYTSDFQPQGRYSMPMLIPLMYFITMGYQRLSERFAKLKKFSRLFYILIAVFSFLLAVFVWVRILYPMYLQDYHGLH